MRIGISTTTIEPSLSFGKIDGIGVYTKNLLQYYNTTQNPVIRVAYPPLRKILQISALSSQVNLFLPYSISSACHFTSLGCYLNKNIENKIDLFHATDYRIPQFKNIPVIATLHDAIMFKHPEWCNPRFRTFKNKLLKHSIKHADHVIAISKAMVSDLIEYWGIDENKISVVYNGITDWWFNTVSAQEKNAILAKFNLKEKKFLLSVGTLQPRKNFMRIIQAYQALPRDIQNEYKLVLIGKNGWQTEELVREINQLAKNNSVLWLQYIADEELRALYQSAKLFLFPSLSEGFGFPILEAFASKTPVLTSNLTSLPEVAGNAAYLVDPYSINEISQGMATLLTNDTLCDELIKRGEARATQFSWTTCAEETLQVYKKMA